MMNDNSKKIGSNVECFKSCCKKVISVCVSVCVCCTIGAEGHKAGEVCGIPPIHSTRCDHTNKHTHVKCFILIPQLLFFGVKCSMTEARCAFKE